MNFPFSQISSLLAVELTPSSVLRFSALLAVACVLCRLIGRLIFRKGSAANFGISSSISVLFLYTVAVILFTYCPGELSRFFQSMPFVDLTQDTLYVLPFSQTDPSVIGAHIFSLFLLCFAMNAIEAVIPKGKTLIGWYILRMVSSLCVFFLYLLLQMLLHSYMPDFLLNYGFSALLGLLAVCLLLGIFKWIIGLILAITNPVLCGIYAFFFSNKIGKLITKSIFTTATVTLIVYCFDYFGFGAISISAGVLSSFFPLLLVLLILWYLLGNVL